MPNNVNKNMRIEIAIKKSQRDMLDKLVKQLGYDDYKQWLKLEILNIHNDAIDRIGIEALALKVSLE